MIRPLPPAKSVGEWPDEREYLIGWLRSSDASDHACGSDARALADALEAGADRGWSPEGEEMRHALDEIEWHEKNEAFPYRGPPITSAWLFDQMKGYGALASAAVNKDAPLISVRR